MKIHFNADKRLTVHACISIIEAVVHLVNRDFVSLTELYRRMGFIPQDVDAAPIVNALKDALPDVLNAPVGQLNFKNVVSRLGDVMFNFPFSVLFYLPISDFMRIIVFMNAAAPLLHCHYPMFGRLGGSCY